MVNKILILLTTGLLFACSTQHRLQKSYAGKPVSALNNEFGYPEIILVNSGDSVYVFKKSEELKSTEINQGRLALDPIVTPSVVKTEHYYFTIKNGMISTVRTDTEYVR